MCFQTAHLTHGSVLRLTMEMTLLRWHSVALVYVLYNVTSRKIFIKGPLPVV